MTEVVAQDDTVTFDETTPPFQLLHIGRAKNWQKVAYLRRNPSPSVK